MSTNNVPSQFPTEARRNSPEDIISEVVERTNTAIARLSTAAARLHESRTSHALAQTEYNEAYEMYLSTHAETNRALVDALDLHPVVNPEIKVPW